MEHKFGIKTFLYYIYQRVVVGFLLLILAVNLPNISRIVISTGGIRLDQSAIDMVNRFGNAVMAIAVVLSFLIMILGLILSWIKYISNTYIIGDYALKLRRGLIAKHEILIPYKQIQSVDTNQSILFRILGLSNLTVLSAGSEQATESGQADQIFKIIDIHTAKYLKAELLKRAHLLD